METTPTPPAASAASPIPLDTRPIADMFFEGGDETRALLARCNVTVAHEIETLGCTGASKTLSIDEIKALRLGLAGGGVGLPCFVGPDRFCLAHNTIGGLQHEQEQRHAELVENISRPLTAKEAGQIAFTEAVRHSAKASDAVGDRISAASGMLSGWGELPQAAELIDEKDSVPEPLPVPTAPDAFTCPEHAALVWTCRFCVAQALVNGELEPVFTVLRPEDGDKLGEGTFGVLGSELAGELEKVEQAGVNEVEIYALVKTLKRRLG